MVQVRDASERVAAEAKRAALEAQLRHSQKLEAIGTLAGGIAHDFNHLLAAIVANVQLAREDLARSHPVSESLEEVAAAAARATALVRQILAFSRKQAPDRARVAPGAVLAEVARLLRATLPASVRVELELDTRTPDVSADAAQLHQVLMNLGTNAWHALGPGGGTVRLRAHHVVVEAGGRPHPDLAPGPYARLQVIDDGRGIEPGILERIFEPFFTTKEPGQGTGLGLSVAHGIVREHRGLILVQSAPGRGSTFEVYLPAQEDAAAAAQAGGGPAAAAAVGQGEVLFLDDEPALVRAAARILRRLGYLPAPFLRASEALDAVRARPDRFAAVITDLTMPEMSGIEVAQQVRQLNPRLPVVLVSGHAERAERDYEAAGIRVRLDKPVELQRFAEVLRQVCGRG
jgi:nitrogen-specific signal transduction histidine kinase/CheY-like chemotaxis protein